MLTAILTFIKGKLFSEAGSFILPLVAILSIFLIWNSETILTKFGFATTTNLKSEIVQLKADIAKLTEANVKLAEDLGKSEKKCNIVTTVTESLCDTKIDTSSKVKDTIDKRKEESDRIKQQYKSITVAPLMKAVPEVKKSLVVTEEKPVTAPAPMVEKENTSSPKVSSTEHTSRADRLSLNNINSINNAYDELFGEN